MLASAGMFHASVAFLPSSFTMYTTCLACASWLLNEHASAVAWIATGALLGWPFAAAAGIPLAIDCVLRRRRPLAFIAWSIAAFVVLSAYIVTVDHHFYRRMLYAPLNIVLYNVFGGGGPDLYGVEPWTYYFVNGFLNFNVVFVLALVSLPVALLVRAFGSPSFGRLSIAEMSLHLSTLYVWFAIFFTRPHKEERFLFTVYPLVCVGAAVALAGIQSLLVSVAKRARKLRPVAIGSVYGVAAVVVIPFLVLSVSRIWALHVSYSAPISAYTQLYREIETVTRPGVVNVCVGKEWYRFPASFLLPHNAELRFIRSEFRAQLPKPFSKQDGTHRAPSDMNDMNREEPSRYFQFNECDYLVDFDGGPTTELEPRYSGRTEEWETLFYRTVP
eukprot:Opistho-2@682